ncbi:hypothetical protein NDK25_07375 [Niallia taxi]|nr:hypothetical protein [Niallia taxi]MDE5052237.1 hypothetical protein [Niallia taxi]
MSGEVSSSLRGVGNDYNAKDLDVGAAKARLNEKCELKLTGRSWVKENVRSRGTERSAGKRRSEERLVLNLV